MVRWPAVSRIPFSALLSFLMKAAMSFLRPLDPEMREIDALLQLAKNIKKERDQPIKFINISTEP